ncbi:hypothetical protein DesfrDRAFT_1387 [Solidesulfovibrio fructosivorans JJ]]|uniref:Uncharacterized protein n=1 Tax=Solidesulfovibrio fructosivorans JJ] TaxID=596151 RepID=E1JUT8_SOLFR|nr:hypothetical protein [Solidesulfovibrio fructosivorans]EFL51852.1 hypothetical protein DesfrDRAFT_1387 [Solidesulfovibrio fructosivorans JJ]]
MSRFTYLTPALFRELDAPARTFAGKPIVVERAEKMEGCYGFASAWAMGLVIRLGEPWRTERNCITIANKVDLDTLGKNPARVLDWSAIPAEDFYRFLTWHEIAHVIHMDAMTYFRMDMDVTPTDIKRRVYRLAEHRADRHAWNVLYPGKEMPLLPGAKAHLAEIEETAVTCKAILEKEKRRKPIEPLPTDPCQYVPVCHAEKGIPWASDVGADPFCLWGTVEDGRIVPAVREVAHG